MQNANSNHQTGIPGSGTTAASPSGHPGSSWLGALASFLSSVVAVLCPVCIPAIGAFLASIGLGFTVSTAFLQPALIGLLLINLAALARSAFLHRRWWVLAAGVGGGALVYGGRYLWFSGPLMWAGAAVLIGTACVNVRLKRCCALCRPT
jgi:hypothetical protein